MTVWKSTYLDDPEQYGGIAPMGQGPYGGTIWTTLNSPDGKFVSTALEEAPATGWTVVE